MQTIPISQAGTTSDRKGIIGGSQIGAVLGLEGYVTPYDVYLAFNGIPKPISKQTEETFGFGHILEEAIAQMFTFKTGMKTVEVPYVYVVPENHNLLIHVDREIISDDGKRRALECKTVSSYAAKKWIEYDNLNEPYIISDLIPEQYLAQVYWYYALGEYDEVYISRITNNKLFTYLVPKPSDSVLKDIIAEVQAFYDRLVSGWVPPMSFSDQKNVKVKEAPDKPSIIADKDALSAVEELRSLKSSIKDLEERSKQLQTQISDYIGENTYLVFSDGRRLVSYATQSRTTIDTTRLKKEKPDIYRAFSKISENRVFRLL